MGRSSVLASFAFAGLVGCGRDPSFEPITNAPPGAVAELHQSDANDARSVRLTEGVAMAIECTDGKRRPCSFEGSTIDDASVATFRRAYADLDQKVVYSQGYQQRSHLDRTVFVVAGKTPGRTTMTVRTGYGDVPLTIEVLPR